ncbi:MAG: hypothetical protein ACRD0P_25155 [Stackebrandtia sp.]
MTVVRRPLLYPLAETPQERADADKTQWNEPEPDTEGFVTWYGSPTAAVWTAEPEHDNA